MKTSFEETMKEINKETENRLKNPNKKNTQKTKLNLGLKENGTPEHFTF
jgi:hypothetical protein